MDGLKVSLLSGHTYATHSSSEAHTRTHIHNRTKQRAAGVKRADQERWACIMPTKDGDAVHSVRQLCACGRDDDDNDEGNNAQLCMLRVLSKPIVPQQHW